MCCRFGASWRSAGVCGGYHEDASGRCTGGVTATGGHSVRGDDCSDVAAVQHPPAPGRYPPLPPTWLPWYPPPLFAPLSLLYLQMWQ